MSKKNKQFNKNLQPQGNSTMSEEETGSTEEVIDTVNDETTTQQDNTTESQNTEQEGSDLNSKEETVTTSVTNQETETTKQPEVAEVAKTAAVLSPDAVSTKAEIVDTKNEVLTKFQEYTRNILTEGSEAEKNLVIGLEDYVEKVAPKKPIDATEGVKVQKSLLELIRSVTHTQDKSLFNKLWKILINYFAEYSGKNQVFHEMYINRFTEYWPAGPVQLEAFRNVTHLLRITSENKANIATVQKLVVVDKVLNKYFAEHARNNVIEFYSK